MAIDHLANSLSAGLATDPVSQMQPEGHVPGEAFRAWFKSQAFWREMLEQLPVGIVVAEAPAGRIAFVNSAFRRIHGGELPAANIVDDYARWRLHHPGGAPCSPQDTPLAQALRGQETHDVEMRFPHPDGSWRDVSVSGSPLRDSEGRIVAAMITVQDITKRKRAEAALRQGEQKLRAAMGAAELGTWIYTFDDNTCLYDEQAQKLYGLDGPAFRHDAQGVQRLFHPDDIPPMWERVRAALDPAGDGRYVVEYRVLLPGGGVRWLNAWGQVEFESAGAARRPVRMVGASRDITERKRMEEALRQSSELLDAVLNSTHTMMACLDRQFNFVFVNRAYAQADQKTPEDFPGRNHFALYPNAENEVIFRRVLETGEPYYAKAKPFEYEEYPERGVSYWDWSLIPIKGADGRVELLTFTLTDVTELKQAEAGLRRANEQLAAADRRKDEFLAMLAHELRNPLAPVRNAAQVLRLVCSGEPRLERQREIIDRQVGHMARLLDDLLDVSRISRGKISLEKQTLALVDVLDQAVEIASPLIRSRRHTLAYAAPSDTLRLEGDPDRLTQIFGNLLTNAAKYTDEGGRIELSVTRNGQDARISVRDNGSGIEPQLLPHVFDLFVQANRTADRSSGGLGIGLTMVRSLVQMHGGQVEAHSAGLGQGSEFIVRLPLLVEADAAQQRPDQDLSRTGRRLAQRILVVDDLVDSANSLAELLELWGGQVRVAHSGEHALAAAREFAPEIILLDIGMPGMDGFETARRLRAEHGPGPFLVALTGYGQSQDREETRAAGFNEHLVKPVDLKLLRKLLAGLKPQG